MSTIVKYATPKIIAGVLGVAVSLGGIWYVVNLLESKGRLEAELDQAQVEIANYQRTLETERARFNQTIANYDEVMSNYMDRIVQADQTSRQLRGTIDRLSIENEELQQCFDMEVPDELLDGLFGEYE